MIVLGIESSCDDTSAAVVQSGKKILSNVVSSQHEFHRRFSGVVPEIASRKHLEAIHYVVQQALDEAGVGFKDVDRIAVTNRPGLIGSLLVGVSAAKGYALYWNKPIAPVNHMAAHLYAPHFENELSYPLAGLIVSGGHTLLVKANGPTEIDILGTTVDDAVGEVYDKIAKYFGLGYPGGPVLDKLASQGDPAAYAFPRSLLDNEANRYNFSFSGIKTAVIHQRERFHKKDGPESLEDIAASFQAAVVDVLEEKVSRLISDTGLMSVAVSGGVAANGYLRDRFLSSTVFDAIFPSRPLCMDNGSMVAGVGYHIDELVTAESLASLDVMSRVVLRGKRRRQSANQDNI